MGSEQTESFFGMHVMQLLCSRLGSPRVLEHLLARRTLIYGTSTTSRIDSAPTWFERLLHSGLPQSDGSRLRHMLSEKKTLRCAQGKPMFDEISEVVMPRAKPQMAGQMVSQVVMTCRSCKPP